MMVPRTITYICLTFLLVVPFVRAEPTKENKEAGPVSYYKEIRPIFAQHCQGCHQPAKPQGGYVMTTHAALLKKSDKDLVGIVPGKPQESSLFEQIISKDGKKPAAMPKNRDPLGEKDVALIKKWIEQGAKDDTPSQAKELIDGNHPPVYELPPVISSIAFSPDGTLLAVAGFHEVLIHKADGSEIVARFVGISERVQSIAFSPDGKRLAAVGGSPARFGEVQVWDVAEKKLKMSQSYTFDTLFGVSWAHDGQAVGFGCADNTVRAVESESGKQILFQGAHNDWVLGTAFSTDSLFLASVSRDRTVKLVEVATQRFIDNVTSITPGALKGGLSAVALKPKKDQAMSKVPPDTPGAKPKLYDELLVGGSDGTPRLYKMHRETKRVIGDDANKVREFEALPGRIFSLAFNTDGTQFVVGSSLNDTGEVRIYQLGDAKRLATCEGQKGGAYAVAFHPDGKQVAAAGFDGYVRLFDATNGKLIKEFIPVPLKK